MLYCIELKIYFLPSTPVWWVFCGCVCSKVQSALFFMQLSWHIITHKAYFCCWFWICFSLLVHIYLFSIKVLLIGLRFLGRPCNFWKYFLIQSRYLICFCSDNIFHFLQRKCYFHMICIFNIPQQYLCISSGREV